MRKQAIVKAPIWNKDLIEGAAVEGEYQKKETFTGDYGEVEKYVVKKPDGEIVCILGSASLLTQFANVPVGSYVWVTYQGVEKSKRGQPVKVYSVDYDDEYQPSN